MDDDDKAATWRSALIDPEFWVLLTVALAAAVGVDWWVVLPLGVTGLSFSSLPKYLTLWPRARRVGAETVWWRTVGLLLFNSLAASVAVFLVGAVLRWLWLWQQL